VARSGAGDDIDYDGASEDDPSSMLHSADGDLDGGRSGLNGRG
jgi:hypothetical protein